MSTPSPTSAERRAFEQFIDELRKDASLIAIAEAIAAIQLSELPLRERDRRSSVVLGVVPLDEASLRRVVEAILAREAPLPQSLIRAAQYIPATHVTASLSVNIVAQPPMAEADDEGATVLLLGSAADHNANISLLGSSGIGYSRVDEPRAYQEVRKEQFCGVVVGPSWWRSLPENSHEAELRRILEISTIPWIRLDVSALSPSAATSLNDVVRQVYGSDRAQSLLCQGSGCDITSADLQNIRSVSTMLASAHKVGFHPGELTADEARLLRAAIMQHVRDASAGQPPSLELMEIRFLHGGLSGARVAIASPDDRGIPIVVKIGDLPSMRKEAQCYTVVERWEGGGAKPHLHFHGDHGLLLVPLIDDGNGNVARTLGEDIQNIVYSDLAHAPAANDHVFSRTASCVASAMHRIATLNSKHAANGGARSVADLCDRSLAGRTIPVGASDVAAILGRARERVAKLDGRATVHGDLHLGNVLVRGGSAPAFIDFGQAGAGHPVQDIAKLDSQIWFRAFRMTGTLESLVELIRAGFGGASVEDLCAKHPWVSQFSSNRLCIAASAAARKEALEVVAGYGGGIGDVAAMYIIYAVSELLASPPSAPVALAFIAALEGVIAA